MRQVQRWTKEAIKTALRERHEKQLSLAWIDMPSGLVQAAANRFGGYSKAVEAAGLNYESVRRHRAWDKDSVIREIRKLHAAGVRMSTAAIKTESQALYGAIRSHFGGFAEAMEAAGIEYRPPKQWGKLVVFDQLRELHRRGEDLSSKNMRRIVPALLDAARTAFGSYQRAIELLGLDYRQISKRVRWDKASVIAEFRRLAKMGMQPRVSEFMKHAPRLVSAAVTQFGTFVKAIKAADIGYEPRRLWTRMNVLKRLRELHRAGEDLWAAGLKRRNGGLYRAAVRLFGSLGAALERAGIDVGEVARVQRLRNGRWCRESIVAALQERQRKGEELSCCGVPVALRDAARRYFGSYAGAVEASGLDYSSIRRRAWDKDSIPRKLVELRAQGEDLSAGGMQKNHGGLLAACWREFGSYQKAIEHAGLDYAEISHFMHWDKETVLRKMRALAGERVDMSFTALQRSHPRLLQAAERAFGRYPDARVAAGVGPPPLTQWNRDKIVAALQEVQRNGESLASLPMQRSYPALEDAARQHFGSYAEAVKAAGFDYEEIRLSREWTRETIVQELRKLDEKDVDLRSSALKRVDGALLQTACRHFGSYQQALEAAGVPYPPKKPLAGWAKSGVLQMLRQLHGDGEDLRFSSMKKRRSALFFAARYYFDSYVAAVKRAGLDYERIVKEQLRGASKWRRAVSEN